MTLFDLQQELGKQIENLSKGEGLTAADFKKAIIICNLAKQMINNADVLLRYSKLQLQDGVKRLLGNEQE